MIRKMEIISDELKEVYGFLKHNLGYYLYKYPFLRSFECQKWFRELKIRSKGKKGFSLGTFRNNCLSFEKYLKKVKKTPKQLIDDVEEDLQKDRRERKNPASVLIRQFFDDLMKSDYAPNTCESYANAIKSFYKHNGFQISVHIPKQDPIKPKIKLTKKLIRKVVNYVPHLRDKVIILVLTSSGMSIEDVLDLRFRDIDLNEKLIHVEFRRVKNNQKYYTFFSTECKDYLKDYVRIYRGKYKKDDFIFVNTWDYQLKYGTFGKILRKASKKIIGNTQINTKAFRRFFKSTLKTSGADPDYVDYMVGHDIGTDKSYIQEELIKDLYLKREHLLTVMKEIDVNQIKNIEESFSKKVDYLEKRMGDLENLIKILLDDMRK